jgi:hypothetical protein
MAVIFTTRKALGQRSHGQMLYENYYDEMTEVVSCRYNVNKTCKFYVIMSLRASESISMNNGLYLN